MKPFLFSGMTSYLADVGFPGYAAGVAAVHSGAVAEVSRCLTSLAQIRDGDQREIDDPDGFRREIDELIGRAEAQRDGLVVALRTVVAAIEDARSHFGRRPGMVLDPDLPYPGISLRPRRPVGRPPGPGRRNRTPLPGSGESPRLTEPDPVGGVSIGIAVPDMPPPFLYAEPAGDAEDHGV